jgi:hypothetical protein
MYNPWWKYKLKSFLGQRNSTWYFDRLCYYYMGVNPRGQHKRILDNALVLLEAEKNGVSADDMLNCLSGFSLNPIYQKADILRNDKLSQEINKHSDKDYRFIFHLPEAGFSMGAHSWFYNLMVAMKYQGIEVSSFWKATDQPEMHKEKTNIIITGFNDYYTSNLDWASIKLAKRQGFRCEIFFSIPLNVDTIDLMHSIRSKYEEFSTIKFYSFHDYEFEPYEGFASNRIVNGFELYFIPFAANPLFHYPSPVVSRELDYIFLGSTNYDKIDRYNSHFTPIFKDYKGYVDGPGWPWSSSFQYAAGLDKYLYAQAKSALNLHLDIQVSNKIELNERTYILNACGANQTVDDPALLRYKFPLCKGASTPFEYFSSFVNSIHQQESDLNSLKLLEKTFASETVFDRVSYLIQEIRQS